MKLSDLGMIKLAWTARSGAHMGNLVGNVADAGAVAGLVGRGEGPTIAAFGALAGAGTGTGASIGHHRGSKNRHKGKSALVGGLATAGGLVGTGAGGVGGALLLCNLPENKGGKRFFASIAAGKLIGSALGVEAGLGINKLFKKKKK